MEVVGIPKALVYWNYKVFLETFLDSLNIKYIVSPDTNKEILNSGIEYCVDDACLPIKIFHGHVNWLKTRCDLIVVPRIMQLKPREYICPKFCGLPEMIKNSIPDLPKITEQQIYATDEKKLYSWFEDLALNFTKDKKKIRSAFYSAKEKQSNSTLGYRNEGYDIKVGLIGHPYSIYDKFSNMDIVNKLNNIGVGVVTEEYIEEGIINKKSDELFKKPFWTFARKSYGAAAEFYDDNLVHGLIYISSFSCGIDSVVIELIKNKIGDFPFLILKIDEHSGEAGLETRVEAFVDMLERRINNENKLSEFGEYRIGGKGIV